MVYIHVKALNATVHACYDKLFGYNMYLTMTWGYTHINKH